MVGGARLEKAEGKELKQGRGVAGIQGEKSSDPKTITGKVIVAWTPLVPASQWQSL